jgi:hypothetical protein
MKTLALISAIIISGMLLLANYQRGENKSNIKDNNFIDAMWEEPTPLYGNQYFTLENKYQPGAYKELGHRFLQLLKLHSILPETKVPSNILQRIKPILLTGTFCGMLKNDRTYLIK